MKLIYKINRKKMKTTIMILLYIIINYKVINKLDNKNNRSDIIYSSLFIILINQFISLHNIGMYEYNYLLLILYIYYK